MSKILRGVRRQISGTRDVEEAASVQARQPRNRGLSRGNSAGDQQEPSTPRRGSRRGLGRTASKRGGGIDGFMARQEKPRHNDEHDEGRSIASGAYADSEEHGSSRRRPSGDRNVNPYFGNQDERRKPSLSRVSSADHYQNQQQEYDNRQPMRRTQSFNRSSMGDDDSGYSRSRASSFSCLNLGDQDDERYSALGFEADEYEMDSVSDAGAFWDMHDAAESRSRPNSNERGGGREAPHHSGLRADGDPRPTRRRPSDGSTSSATHDDRRSRGQPAPPMSSRHRTPPRSRAYTGNSSADSSPNPQYNSRGPPPPRGYGRPQDAAPRQRMPHDLYGGSRGYEDKNPDTGAGLGRPTAPRRTPSFQGRAPAHGSGMSSSSGSGGPQSRGVRRARSDAASAFRKEPDDADAGAREDEHKRTMLTGQKEREEKAGKTGHFVKNQRVRYYHKLSNTWFEGAHVVSVHYDDGPDKPYFTVKYLPSGSSQLVEKQTTGDRLEGVPWDQQKSWHILTGDKAKMEEDATNSGSTPGRGPSITSQIKATSSSTQSDDADFDHENTAASREEAQKNRTLDGQKSREEAALDNGQYTKNQRVRYFHKISGTWYDDAHVAAVHFDDDPEKPYYTVKYTPMGASDLIEKQTTADRLDPVEWDVDRTWEILTTGKQSIARLGYEPASSEPCGGYEGDQEHAGQRRAASRERLNDGYHESGEEAPRAPPQLRRTPSLRGRNMRSMSGGDEDATMPKRGLRRAKSQDAGIEDMASKAPPIRRGMRRGARDTGRSEAHQFGLSQEERQRAALLSGQKQREEQAYAGGKFVKNQRVRYFHKFSNTWFEDAHVVSVHYDDGPDKPFFTVKYLPPGSNEVIEKQTTGDRLEAVSWDEDKTWELLKGSVGRLIAEAGTPAGSQTGKESPDQQQQRAPPPMQADRGSQLADAGTENTMPRRRAPQRAKSQDAGMDQMTRPPIRRGARRGQLQESGIGDINSSPQDQQKNAMLAGQKEREQNAYTSGQYVKNQRVRYFHKFTNTWYNDAHVVSVHYDDGPDKAYFTVKYMQPGSSEIIEKQTTGDRLEAVSWDEAKTWDILNGKMPTPSAQDSQRLDRGSDQNSAHSGRSDDSVQRPRNRRQGASLPDERAPPLGRPQQMGTDRRANSQGDNVQQQSPVRRAPRRAMSQDAGMDEMSSAPPVRRGGRRGPNAQPQEPAQDQQKATMLAGQREREEKAYRSGHYVKNQRVRYFHKFTNTWFDTAHVVSVHFDDGPDKPYFTVKYLPPGANEMTEKQTTGDRLEAVPWDEDRTWDILCGKIPKPTSPRPAGGMDRSSDHSKRAMERNSDHSRRRPNNSQGQRPHPLDRTVSSESDEGLSPAERERAQRTRMLSGQREREDQARQSGQLVKHQRVRYFHKFSGTWFDEAHVAAVHFDDDPQKPYYTVKYQSPGSNEVIEKQTTRDRLEASPWDENKTWAIIGKKVQR